MNSSKGDARKSVDLFFEKSSFSSGELKKIKTLAMKHRIRLGTHRSRFCKKCLTDLRNGLGKITKTHKTITCPSCSYKNKVRIS